MWENVPYELQSPAWRSAMNETPTTPRTWNPSINANRAADILSAFRNIGTSNAAASGINTAQIDGQSNFVENLSGFGSALLQSLGVRSEGQVQPQQVAYNQPSAFGIDQKTLMVIGLVGVGIYVAFVKK